MKHLRTLMALIATISGVVASRAIVPQVDYQARWYSVNEVEMGNDVTRVGVTLTNQPGYWCRLDSSTVLVDRATGKEYVVIGAEGMTLGDKVWMPAEGRYDATLIFEPLPEGVKVVDMIEKSNPEQTDVIYGIHLTKERDPRPQKQTVPMFDAPAWDGFNADRYRDMDFVRPGATAHIIGKIDNYVPQLGYSVVKIIGHDQLNLTDNVTVADIDSTGAFVTDVPLSHPQKLQLSYGDRYASLFLMPGDTLRYTTTTLQEYKDGDRVPAYSLYDGGESAGVNIAVESLADSLSRYKLRYGVWTGILEQPDSVLACKDRMADNVRGAIGYLNRVIPMLDLSQRQKDLLFTMSLTDLFLQIEDMGMRYRDKRYDHVMSEEGNAKREDNPDFMAVGDSVYYSGMQDFIGLIYDNPLAMCGEWIIINRAAFSPMFRTQNMVAGGVVGIEPVNGTLQTIEETLVGDGESRTDRLRIFDERRRKILGLGSCFMSELLTTQYLVHRFVVSGEDSVNPMEEYCELASCLMPLVTHKALARNVIDGIAKMALETGMKNASSATPADDSRSIADVSEVLANIVEPYKGEVVYVDIWAFWCGPCRSGILAIKDLVKEYSDKPFKVVYVAEDTGKVQCERWLDENGIEGERVYVSTDAYARLSSDFNISGIPFVILIAKDGRIVDEGHVRLSFDGGRLERLVSE